MKAEEFSIKSFIFSSASPFSRSKDNKPSTTLPMYVVGAKFVQVYPCAQWCIKFHRFHHQHHFVVNYLRGNETMHKTEELLLAFVWKIPFSSWNIQKTSFAHLSWKSSDDVNIFSLRINNRTFDDFGPICGGIWIWSGDKSKYEHFLSRDSSYSSSAFGFLQASITNSTGNEISHVESLPDSGNLTRRREI